MQTISLRGDGVNIAADIDGPTSGATVVLLPGGGQTRFSWGAAVQQLAHAGYRVASLDLRGHGESGWAADGDYTLSRFVEDLTAVLGQLPSPAFLVGASLGGITSLVVAGERHAAVAGLVLVDVVPRIEPDGAGRIGAFMRASPNGFASVDEAADAVSAYMPHRPRPKDTSGLLKNLRLGADGRYRWHWDPAFTGRELSSTEFLHDTARLEAAARALKIPTLLIRGGLSTVVSEEGVRQFEELAPDAEVVNIASADHMVAGDRNDLFNDAVIDFLARHADPPLSKNF